MTQLPAAPAVASRLLTAEAFQRLADVPPEVEWFANLTNRCTRRAYENALRGCKPKPQNSAINLIDKFIY